MSRLLEVFVGDTPAGVLKIEAVPGRRDELVTFEYSDDWLSRGFSLSPELPLRTGRHAPTLGRSLFGAFADASPDQWGKRLLRERARRDGINVSTLTDAQELLLVPDNTRPGALRFSEGSTLLDPSDGAADWSALDEAREQATIAFEDGPSHATWGFLGVGASSGGAHPKATFRDGQGHLWMAKFPNQSAPLDQGRWEEAAARAQRDAGIAVADTQAIPVNEWNAVFVTKRFDRSDDGGRIPFVSFHTMLQRTGQERAQPSYSELGRAIRRWSCVPEQDGEQLFRRAAFNVLVGNNDDHMRNFGLLRGRDGWRLSPSFDVNPLADVPSDVSVVEGGDPARRSIDELLLVGADFGLEAEPARRILEHVIDAANELTDHALNVGLEHESLGSRRVQALKRRIADAHLAVRDAGLGLSPTSGVGADRCQVCGSKLRSPESIARGIGPECAHG